MTGQDIMNVPVTRYFSETALSYPRLQTGNTLKCVERDNTHTNLHFSICWVCQGHFYFCSFLYAGNVKVILNSAVVSALCIHNMWRQGILKLYNILVKVILTSAVFYMLDMSRSYWILQLLVRCVYKCQGHSDFCSFLYAGYVKVILNSAVVGALCMSRSFWLLPFKCAGDMSRSF